MGELDGGTHLSVWSVLKGMRIIFNRALQSSTHRCACTHARIGINHDEASTTPGLVSHLKRIHLIVRRIKLLFMGKWRW